MEKRLLSVKETAEYIGISTNTLYSWVSRRKIPYVKVGRLTKFDRKDLDSWIEDNKFEAKSFDL